MSGLHALAIAHRLHRRFSRLRQSAVRCRDVDLHWRPPVARSSSVTLSKFTGRSTAGKSSDSHPAGTMLDRRRSVGSPCRRLLPVLRRDLRDIRPSPGPPPCYTRTRTTMIPARQLASLIAAVAIVLPLDAQSPPPPIIDMHMHALATDAEATAGCAPASSQDFRRWSPGVRGLTRSWNVSRNRRARSRSGRRRARAS